MLNENFVQHTHTKKFKFIFRSVIIHLPESQENSAGNYIWKGQFNQLTQTIRIVWFSEIKKYLQKCKKIECHEMSCVKRLSLSLYRVFPYYFTSLYYLTCFGDRETFNRHFGHFRVSDQAGILRTHSHHMTRQCDRVKFPIYPDLDVRGLILN